VAEGDGEIKGARGCARRFCFSPPKALGRAHHSLLIEIIGARPEELCSSASGAMLA
jgi:hypothetical protein